MENYDVMEQSNSSRLQPDAPGFKVELPKIPEYADYSKRMESFATWIASTVGKEELVESGMIYLGVGDSCRCYYCGGGFSNWEAGDNPMREHAKRYPKCQHILVVKGQTYIDEVLNGELVEEGASQNVADDSIPECNYLEMPACLSCIEMGFSKEMVQKAVQIFISKNKHSDFKGADICEILLDLEANPDYEIQDTVENEREAVGNINPENLNILKEENKRLEETKLYFDKRAYVTFRPCGHTISCAHCAISMTKCPVCGK